MTHFISQETRDIIKRTVAKARDSDFNGYNDYRNSGTGQLLTAAGGVILATGTCSAIYAAEKYLDGQNLAKLDPKNFTNSSFSPDYIDTYNKLKSENTHERETSLNYGFFMTLGGTALVALPWAYCVLSSAFSAYRAVKNEDNKALLDSPNRSSAEESSISIYEDSSSGEELKPRKKKWAKNESDREDITIDLSESSSSDRSR
jgi:hypothetical protein